jgi:hypothetical protein
MDESGRGERVPGTLARQVALCGLAELLEDEGHKGVRGRTVAACATSRV